MIIGIDLGTSTTEAAVYRNGKVELIPNPDGKLITPSAIGLDDNGDIIVGEKAKSQYIVYPERTAIEVKRKLGTDERIKLGDKHYTPVELSSMLLKYVRGFAGDYLKEEVSHAVISVPAYFDNIQRQEVIKAGEMAGFTVERLISEPTAAALSYGMGHMEEESYILVYDLGGGTFDVTLLEMFDGVLEVRASKGDNQLGGKDFDESIMGYLRERFKANTGVVLDKNLYALARLKEQAESCKLALSSEDKFEVRLPMLAEKNGMPLGLEETVTKQKFEELIKSHIQRTHGPVYSVLEDGGIGLEELDKVLLVGGSTRVPLVQEDIEKLTGQPPASSIHPDYSVAEGAAIQAAIIDGVLSGERGIVMTDVNPFSLGVSAVTDFEIDSMAVVIPRNTTIPVTKKDVFYTYADGQTTAEIKVYQGESRTASDNHFLGKFRLSGIPPAKAGKEVLEIAFSYDLNGILKIEATVLSNRKSADLTVNMLEAEAPERRIDVSAWKLSPEAGPFRGLVRRAEKKLKKIPEKDPQYEELEELLYDLKKAVLEGDIDSAEEDAGELEWLMEEL